MTLSETLALWADRLRDISSIGLLFADNIYHRQRYEALQDIALEMFALATGELPEQLEPLRATVMRQPSAISTADAAIIDEAGRMLLIRRADNGRWAMPGGLLEVGETPAEGAVREALEETGVRCEPLALVAVHDSRLCGATSPHHLYLFTFLCRPLDGGQPPAPPSHANETLDMAWFAEPDLPEDLSRGHVRRIPEAFRVWRGDPRAYFDR